MNYLALYLALTLLAICLLGWGFHEKPVFFLNIFSGVPHVDYMPVLGLPNYWSDSWRRYNLKSVC